MKIVIVGGVAGGASAAARIRRLKEDAEIVMYERSGYISYANCGLPYYVGGEIEDREDLTLQTPEGFRRRFRVDVRVRCEVTRIDPAEKRVTVRELDTGREFTDRYDGLLLAPGATPVLPALDGGIPEGVFTLRTVEDALRIREELDRTRPQSAIVIGGGFIGVEMAENLCARGMRVTVLQKGSHLLNTLDGDMASFVHAKCRARGIDLRFGVAVRGIGRGTDGFTVKSDCGTFSADAVILAVGVKPESDLARQAGLTLGTKGAIAVDDRMETSVKGIYAVGDAVEIRHAVTGAPAVIALAGPANRQARVAADNLCGMDSRYRGSFGASVLKLFDTTVASVGITETAARAAGIDCEAVILSPLSHAGYYPGAEVMTLKVLFERGSARLLGAQAVGGAGVDKRIDVLATAMAAGMPADRLKDLDLAYAPPYSSAKDPVNLAGCIVDNLCRGVVKQFYYGEIAALRARTDVTLLDTRTDGEYARGHAEGFRHIPLDALRDRLGELDREKPVYVMCQSGLRSYLATRILTENGFDAYNFAGGYRLYASIEGDLPSAGKVLPCGAETPN